MRLNVFGDSLMTPCSRQFSSRAVLYNRMKLMLVGVQGIGKTSLLNQLRKEDKAGSVKNKVLTNIHCITT